MAAVLMTGAVISVTGEEGGGVPPRVNLT